MRESSVFEEHAEFKALNEPFEDLSSSYEPSSENDNSSYYSDNEKLTNVARKTQFKNVSNSDKNKKKGKTKGR